MSDSKPTPIAVILPSRGLVHSRTMDSLCEALTGIEYKFFFTHDLAIPDCFNVPLGAAQNNPDTKYFVIVEEDMFVPKDAFKKLIDADADISFYDYPMDDGTRATQHFTNGWSSGTGLICFKREALEQLFPFRSNISYAIQGNELVPNEIPEYNRDNIYGKHDIDLFIRANNMKMNIKEVGKTDHYRVTEMGKRGVNKGFHHIRKI